MINQEDEGVTSQPEYTLPKPSNCPNYRDHFTEPEMHDVDRDDCLDLVMVRSAEEVGLDAPLVYRNNGSGQFRAMPPEPFAGEDRYFGLYAVPADVNGDGVIDFVAPQRHDGPDDEPRTADDFGSLVVLMNTTPVGPVRCGN